MLYILMVVRPAADTLFTLSGKLLRVLLLTQFVKDYLKK